MTICTACDSGVYEYVNMTALCLSLRFYLQLDVINLETNASKNYLVRPTQKGYHKDYTRIDLFVTP